MFKVLDDNGHYVGNISVKAANTQKPEFTYESRKLIIAPDDYDRMAKTVKSASTYIKKMSDVRE